MFLSRVSRENVAQIVEQRRLISIFSATALNEIIGLLFLVVVGEPVEYSFVPYDYYRASFSYFRERSRLCGIFNFSSLFGRKLSNIFACGNAKSSIVRFFCTIVIK